MKETEIASIFETLPLPQASSASSCSFTAVSLPDCDHKLGKDEGGCPCLLVATGGAPKSEPRVPLVLENLAVLFDLNCQVSSPISPTQLGTFAVLKCVATDLVVRSYFLSLLPGISTAIGRSGDRAKVAAVVEDLVELFRALGTTPKKEIQGLWGELLLIREAEDPVVLAQAWHAEPGDRYDFNKGQERLDVKTTSQVPRRHHFLLEQLCPPIGTRLIVASIVVQRSGAGLSVFDLLDAICRKVALQPQLHLRLASQVHQTLGDSWQNARSVRFDYEAAKQSIQYYDSAQIPKVLLPLPEGVSQVSFVADMNGIATLSAKAFGENDTLYPRPNSAMVSALKPRPLRYGCGVFRLRS